MYTEFITDMGERLDNQPFRSTYTYTYSNDEIIYDTGLKYIASLEQSYNAAVQDVANGTFHSYHSERQRAFKEQGSQILSWLQTDNSSQHLLLVSLCPPEEELSYAEAKKQSFKPDRMMASVQLHSKNIDGTTSTAAFSLDGLTLDNLQKLLNNLGLDSVVAPSTLEQVTKPIEIHSLASADVVVDSIIQIYDMQLGNESHNVYSQGISNENNIVEANSFVANHPETFILYRTIIEQVATSLNIQTVTDDLAHTVANKLAQQYPAHSTVPAFLTLVSGDSFTPYIAGELIDYLRRRAIPEYLKDSFSTQNVASRQSIGDIGSAGVSATLSGRVYDGACPSSATVSAEQSVIDQAMRLGLNVAATVESPKPLFIVGNYAVIPIGSCPASCGTECGIGIKDVRTGSWYCANSKRCSGYNSDVYNFVFNPGDTKDEITRNEVSHTETNYTENRLTHDVSIELREVQSIIWQLRSFMFNEALTDAERQNIITDLITADQRKQHLLRVAIGSEAYIHADSE
jgi:hypothetical protein